PEDLYQFHAPEEIDFVHHLDSRKTLVNVGSVGQPRDGDWRACYVLLDGEAVRFRRVEYDIETTIRKIHEIPDLDDFLGDRLPEDLYHFHAPEEIDFVHHLDSRKTLVNVGSVGQPRDGDWRACYVLLDGEAVRFRRVEYDIETTIRKIHEIPDLDDFLGDRLR